MRILLTILLLNLSLAQANDDKSIQELLKKYDEVTDQKKLELIDEVFTKNYIKGSGGKEELILKIKTLPTVKKAQGKSTKPQWRKGLKGNMYYVKLKEEGIHKNKKVVHETELIILNEDGKLKIDGNIGDAN